MTTPNQIAIARAITDAIKGNPMFEDCILDDWDDYGGFQAFAIFPHTKRFGSCLPVNFKKGVMREMTYVIRAVLKAHNCVINYVSTPKRHYYCSNRRKWFDGYEDDAIKFDFNVTAI